MMKNGLQAAFQLHRAGDLAAAERTYRQILIDTSKDLNALHLLGLNLHEQGKDREAVVFLEQAVEIGPTIGVLYNSLGVARMALGDLRIAESCFRKAISLDSACEEARRNLAAVSLKLQGQTSVPKSPEASSRSTVAIGDSEQAEQILRQRLGEFPDDLNAYIKLARHWMERGKTREVIDLLSEPVERFPQSVELANCFGEAFGQENRHEEAEQIFKRLLERFPENVTAHVNYGVSQLAQERASEAVTSFERALELNPEFFRAYLLIAVSRRQSQQFDAAEMALQRALELRPGSSEALVELAHLERLRGNPQKGLEILTEILFRDPCHGPALLGLATCCEILADPDQVVQYCVKALKANAKFAPAHLLLGMVLASRLTPDKRARLELTEREELGERALLHLSSAAKFAPSAEAMEAWGAALINMGRHAEALGKIEESIRLASGFAPAHESLGKIYLEQGRIDDACAAFSAAVRFDPRRALAQFELARSKKVDDVPRSIQQVRGLLDRGDLPFREQVLMHFALAGLYDADKNYDAAFEHYQIANRLKCEDPRGLLRSGDREMQKRAQFHTQEFMEIFGEEYFREHSDRFGSESELPVFIVGMPRSGTTLVEQILSSHPDVYGAGERVDIADLTLTLPRRLNSEARYPQAASLLTQQVAREMADSYLEQLRKLAASALRVTDKMPINFRHLGFIARLFPRAQVIHVRRDPLDVCVSCFRQNLEWPFCDLDAAAIYFQGYRRLMAHWKEVTSLRILDVRYEELVANQEEESRRMVEFCGLPWDEACLDFQGSKRAVQTPSKWQVRQPVYHSSVGAWKRYERHLDSLKKVLPE